MRLSLCPVFAPRRAILAALALLPPALVAASEITSPTLRYLPCPPHAHHSGKVVFVSPLHRPAGCALAWRRAADAQPQTGTTKMPHPVSPPGGHGHDLPEDSIAEGRIIRDGARFGMKAGCMARKQPCSIHKEALTAISTIAQACRWHASARLLGTECEQNPSSAIRK